MIRCGEICASCKGGCQADPKIYGDLEIECVDCNGTGCPRCHDGKWSLSKCPKTFIDSTTVEVIRMSDAKKDGLLPVSGGILDQSQSIISAIEFYQSDVNKIEAEQYK